MPGTLSGGEQQRVALARALAPEPGVILLDEPFSSLDAGLRWHLRSDVRRLLKGIGVTTILVTHDQDEALTFGDRVAVMRAGTIEQVGAARGGLRPPGDAVGRHVRRRDQPPRRRLRRRDGGDTAIGRLPRRRHRDGAGAGCCCRPEQLALDAGGPATVAAVSYFGRDTRYEVDVPGAGTVDRAHAPAHPSTSPATPSPCASPLAAAHGWPAVH